MIYHAYIIIILSFASRGNSINDSDDKSNKQVERLKRSASSLSERSFKSVIVYNDAITTLSTSTWPRYVIKAMKTRNDMKILISNILNI